ncbi:uncharacterized protein LOC132745341 [Ruditapes philippinarum]|uniref:uncharacterized protein LOC132745341 n=1 Tax=Ruditapes philippinarum TaxID=129788 RepID=UPI00295B0901|nr:uncharacterized protein LOC132745341 [Ruditapes philippinarum]
MFQTPDNRENLSLKLSEVLDDIGINEQMVMRRREMQTLKENVATVVRRFLDEFITIYILGSQSEGTTTIGLHSDIDTLYCYHDYNIIQDLSEWEYDKDNYFMIQDENTTPGYCFLQLLRHDRPLPATDIPDKDHITDRKGRILLKNSKKIDLMCKGAVQHGPSIAKHGQHLFYDRDLVLAFPCKSWPQSASGWLERQGIGRWPTQQVKRDAASTPCFVVPTGSKVSVYPELEWRISTSVAERCIMFNLNITQIRCLVLMKMILKSFLNPQGGINLSSFMCKTVLLHCIENTERSKWKENNLLTCLIFCLLELNRCIQNDHCSHFIIQENNLFAGQFTPVTKYDLSNILSDFIQSIEQMILGIDIDDLGCRLQVKLNIVPQRAYDFPSSFEIREENSFDNNYKFAMELSDMHFQILEILNDEHNTTMKQSVEILVAYSKIGNWLAQDSFHLILPFLFTTHGTLLASYSIGENNQVSPETMALLLNGVNSDYTSGRLKLASVLYCTGDMENAEIILRHKEQTYHFFPVLPVCNCWENTPPQTGTAEFMSVCTKQSIKHNTAFCVRFIRPEINCVPHELQYEMFRSTQDDMTHRDKTDDCWMDWATVDSLPFLYFLQYKVYGHLQRYLDQQQALNKLIKTIETDENLGHRETALNILGQCMEQENRPQHALKCYMLSLGERKRNNAAKYHICRLLSRVLDDQ